MRTTFLVAAAGATLAAAAIAYVGAGQTATAPAQGVAPSDVAGLQARTARNPDDAESWKALAVALRKAGRTEEAVAAYVRAARVTPRDSEIIAALRDLAESLD